MNKISKKIVSLATMAAFTITMLVPMTAFAEDTPATTNSTVVVRDAAIAEDGQAAVNVTVGNLDENENIVLWVQDKNGIYADATYTGTGGSVTDGTSEWDNTAILAGTTKGTVFTVKIGNLAADNYTVYAAVSDNNAATTMEDLTPIKITEKNTITVAKVATTDKSTYGVMDENGQVLDAAEVAAGADLTTEFRVNDIAGDATADTLAPVWIWATQGKKIVKIGEVKDADGTVINPTGNAYKLNSVVNGTKVVMNFAAAGDYVLHAGEGTTLADAQKNENILLGETKVTVTDETVVDSMSLEATREDGTKVPMTFNADTNTYELNLAKDAANFKYNGIEKIILNGKAVEEDGTPAKAQTIDFGTTRTDVVEFTKTTDSTDNDGLFDTKFSMQGKKNAVVTVTDEATGLKYNVRVIAATTSAQNIDRTLTGGTILAGTDSNWTTDNAWFTDAVQFKITDEKGNAVTGPVNAKIEVRDRAKGSTLTATDLALKDSGNGVYTLVYTDTANHAKDLTEGKYEVRVAIDSEDNATVTFTAAKFGKVKDTVLDVHAIDADQTPANPNEEWMTVDDQITLGQMIFVDAKYVDENGLKIDADGVQYGFNGKAAKDVNPKNGTFVTPADVPANESLLGTEVEVVAFNGGNKQLVTKTLTVVDSYTDKSLEFDETSGPINEDNTVKVSVVDKDGKVQQVEGSMTAWVADKSNEDANVNVSVETKEGHHAVTDGNGTMTVYSDKETTADIVVAVKAGTEVYYGTLEYTFGKEDVLADRTVVMSIGSTKYVVNNNIITGDAAPYVDSNWRTMVPIRALAEAFDAEVNWNGDKNTVTINFDGDTQIVMTVGEKTYSVNAVDAEMDTEPVNNGSRVYVPIRFAAEDLGFSVTPLYNDNGLTASVVFQR